MLFFCKLAFAVTLFTVPPISSLAICHDLWQKNLTHNLQRNHWHENECYKNVSGFYTDQDSHLNSKKIVFMSGISLVLMNSTAASITL